MSSDFFIAKENSEKYDTVCDIRKKSNRVNSNVLEAFSGLECPGEELHEWESYKPLYISKFKKGKQCLQRRLTKMKEFSGHSEANKTSRKKHVYPVQVAYAYGQDCLKKFASRKEQDTYKQSVDELINKISETRKNVKGYFGESIEDSIKSRSNSDPLKKILTKQYYDEEQLGIINRERNLGYNALNEDDKDKFFSIYNEGFSKNATYNKSNNIINELNNKNGNGNENGNGNGNENIIILRPSKTLKKNFKHRRSTKRKQKTDNITPNINLTNLNAILKSNNFKITNQDIIKHLKTQIMKLFDLYKEKVYNDGKIYLLEDILTTFNKIDKITQNVYNNAKKASSLLSVSKKSAKKAGIAINFSQKYLAVTKRKKLSDDINKTYKHLEDKADEISDKIVEIMHDNDTYSKVLRTFFWEQLPQYAVEVTDAEIKALNGDKIEELAQQQYRLNSLKKIIKDINSDIETTELKLKKNLEDQKKAKQALNEKDEKRKIKNESLRILFETKLVTLKEQEHILDKSILEKYNEKTEKIRDLLQEISKNYTNPLIFKQNLEETKKIANSIKNSGILNLAYKN
jgi:hypothetical protein